MKSSTAWRDRPVEDGDGEALVVHVQDQVLAHHGQPDESDVRLCHFSRCSFVKGLFVVLGLPEAGLGGGR